MKEKEGMYNRVIISPLADVHFGIFISLVFVGLDLFD